VAAALTTVLLDPIQFFSAGFQMSYSVVAALILMGAPLAQAWAERWQPFRFLPEVNWRWWHTKFAHYGRLILMMLAAGWTAFLASTPAGIAYFGVLSPGSLVANLIIIPLTSVAISAGFVALLVGLLGLGFLSVGVNRFAILVIQLVDWLLQHAVNLPGMFFSAHFRADWLGPFSVVVTFLIFLAGAAGRWERRWGGYWPPCLFLLLLLLLDVRFGA
jgi:competence protein ComEC